MIVSLDFQAQNQRIGAAHMGFRRKHKQIPPGNQINSVS